MCACVQLPTEHRGVRSSLKLELEEVVSHPMWVMGTEFGTSFRTACALNHEAPFLWVLVAHIVSSNYSVYCLVHRNLFWFISQS